MNKLYDGGMDGPPTAPDAADARWDTADPADVQLIVISDGKTSTVFVPDPQGNVRVTVMPDGTLVLPQ